MRVLIVEGEPYLAEAVRDGLRLEAIAGDGDSALSPSTAVSSALERAWNADAVRITVSESEPWLTATVPGVGHRLDAVVDPARLGGTHE